MKIERDDARRRIVVIGTGTISIADIRSVVDQQHADGTWHYGLLYDFRDATTSITGADTRALAFHTEHGAPARGPVAVVATDPAFYGVARMYSMLTETAGLRFAVFRDRAQAERWLDDQQAQS